MEEQQRDALHGTNRPQTLEQWQLGLRLSLRTTRHIHWMCQTICSVWRAHQRAPLLRVWEIFGSSRLECVMKRMVEFTAAKCKTSEQEGQRRRETQPCATTSSPSGQIR